MKYTLTGGRLMTLAAFLAFASSASAVTRYDIINVGNLGGSSINPNDMNELGQVVGNGRTVDGYYHPFYYDGNTLYDLTTMLGFGEGTGNAFGINDNGVIVGIAKLPPENFDRYFIYDQTAIKSLSEISSQLPLSSSSIRDINNSGVIVGNINSNDRQAITLTPNGSDYDVEYIGIPGMDVSANAINEAGQVAGFARLDSPSGDQAFLFDGQQIINLDTLPGFTTATDLADPLEPGLAPLVVGYGFNGSQTIGWKDDGTGLQDIGVYDGNYSNALSTNNAGQIVGWAHSSSYSYRYAVVFEDGYGVDLNTRIAADSGWRLKEARAINNAGLIMGLGEFNGVQSTFILRPINESPIAVAGEDYHGVAGAAVLLDGTASYDPEGAPLTYQWDFGDGTGATGSTPEHVYTASGSYIVTLTVSDGNSTGAASATALIDPAPLPPIADAGADFSAAWRRTTYLDGSGSTDPDGTIVSYQWRQVSGSAVTLTGANTARPSFVTPAPWGTLEFELTVTDDSGMTNSDRVSVRCRVW